MDIQEFFNAVLPTSGWFYVVRIDANGDVRHKGYLASDASTAYEWAIHEWQRKKYNVYFTPCTWTQQYVTNEKGQNKNCRKHRDLTHKLKSFWLDIDSKKDGNTVEQSVAELVKFCQSIKLPLPNVIVKTGGGLHVYWTLQDELTLTQWLPMADALKSACIASGMKADHACTTDPARILRIPFSDNYKYSPPVRATVASIKQPVDYNAFSSALRPFWNSIKESGNVNDEFSSKNGVEYVKGRIERVVQECPLFAEVLATGGAKCSEPLWQGVLHNCAHAEDGVEWAHRLSSAHPGYTIITTDNKLAECNTNIPPTGCGALEERYWESPAPCANCQHKGKVKNPLMLGRDRTEGSIKKPNGLPDGYFVTTSGIFHSFVKDGDDQVERVTQLPILSIEVHDVVENSSGDSIVAPHIQMYWMDSKGGKHKGMFPMAILPDYRSLYATLSAIKFPYTKLDHKNGFDTLMTSWVQRLREEGNVTTGKPQFGWHRKANGEVEGFAIGRTMYLPDGTNMRMMWPETQLNHIYTTAGSLDEWKKAVALMQKRNRPELMTLIAGAFAAPLFTFLGNSSAVVSAVSQKSGVGKSSALKVAQAVWGSPKTGMTSLDDTPKSVAKKMGTIRHLPVFWDELRLTDKTAPEFLQMMFQLSQGRERTRLAIDLKFRETGTWETILICASNNRLSDIAYEQNIRSNANLKRLFEYDIAYDSETPQAADGTEVFNNLNYNYGHAGVEYAMFLVQNAARVKSEVLAMNKVLTIKTGAGNEDRFWVGTMACLLMGARYAKELKLVDFDTKGLMMFLMATYQSMQTVETEVIETDFATNTLFEFLRETSGSGIMFRNESPKPRKGIEPLNIHRAPMANTKEGLLWEYYIGDGVLRVCRAPLMDYLRRKRVNRKEFLKDIEAQGFFYSECKVTFAPDTRFESLGRQHAYSITIPTSERRAILKVEMPEGGEAES